MKKQTNTEPWVPTTNDFATRLAMVRQRMGWNLKEAAIECELGINDWARWESGMQPRNYPQAITLISQRTGVDIFWLMTGQVPRPGGDDPRGLRMLLSPLSDSNRRPPLYIVDGSLEHAEWPNAEPKRKQAA